MHPVVRLLFWSSEECEVTLHCYYIQDDSDLERLYLLGSHLLVKSFCDNVFERTLLCWLLKPSCCIRVGNDLFINLILQQDNPKIDMGWNQLIYHVIACKLLAFNKNIWNHITVGKLLVLDRNTWNYLSVCMLFILRIDTWSNNCLPMIFKKKFLWKIIVRQNEWL